MKKQITKTLCPKCHKIIDISQQIDMVLEQSELKQAYDIALLEINRLRRLLKREKEMRTTIEDIVLIILSALIGIFGWQIPIWWLSLLIYTFGFALCFCILELIKEKTIKETLSK